MTTEVISFCHSRPSLVCQLREITPDEAIAKLSRAGILAIEGDKPNTIVLLGFSQEVRTLLDDLRVYGIPVHAAARYTLGKLRKLSLAT
jgi:hypothetical protein